MKLKKCLSIATVALSSLLISTQQVSAIRYSFSDADPNPFEPLSVSGFFDIDDSLGMSSGIVEFDTELVDYFLEIGSSTPGVDSVTLTPADSTVFVSNLVGVTVSPSQLDFSSTTGGGGLCISNTIGCGPTSTPGEATFLLDDSVFVLELGLEGDSDSDSGPASNFPQQINSDNSTSVPEFSPTLSLILGGSLFALARYRRSRQAKL